MTRDSWEGNEYQPITYNKWLYSNANPILYTDPSGHLACKDIVSGWRDVFEKLGLCDPSEEPTISPQRMEELEKFQGTLDKVICTIGLTDIGGVCVSNEDEEQCFLPGYVDEQEIFGHKVLNKQCQKILDEIRGALSKVINRYDDWVANRLGGRDPGHIKSYLQEQVRLRAALEKWERHNCGYLPGEVNDAWSWVYMPLP